MTEDENNNNKNESKTLSSLTKSTSKRIWKTISSKRFMYDKDDDDREDDDGQQQDNNNAGTSSTIHENDNNNDTVDGKINDTELVTAIKMNETKPSHFKDVAQLEEQQEDNVDGSSTPKSSL